MKKFVLASVSLFALGASSEAHAADLPLYTKAPVAPAPFFDWSGFYAGINAGGGFAHADWRIVSLLGAAVDPAVGEGRHNAEGAAVGGQFGYRWQVSKWVFGLEAQGDWADFSGSNVSAALAPQVNQSKIDAFGLFTGQIGYTTNSLLLYGKAGGGIATARYNSFVPGGAALDGVRQTRWGATLGIGLDYGFAENWSIGGEYDHLFLGHHDADVPALVGARTDSIGQDVDVAVIRINYRWGGPIAARY